MNLAWIASQKMLGVVAEAERICRVCSVDHEVRNGRLEVWAYGKQAAFLITKEPAGRPCVRLDDLAKFLIEALKHEDKHAKIHH